MKAVANQSVCSVLASDDVSRTPDIARKQPVTYGVDRVGFLFGQGGKAGCQGYAVKRSGRITVAEQLNDPARIVKQKGNAAGIPCADIATPQVVLPDDGAAVLIRTQGYIRVRTEAQRKAPCLSLCQERLCPGK